MPGNVPDRRKYSAAAARANDPGLTGSARTGKLREANHSESAVSILENLKSQMSLPVIAAPMFIVSNLYSVIAQYVSGVIGSFPALNARAASIRTICGPPPGPRSP
jgi:hypothetical protein